MTRKNFEKTYLLNTEVDNSGCVPARFVFVFLSFFGFFNIYAMRVNLSVALVAMVNSSALSVTTNVTSECKLPNSTVIEAKGGEFLWDQSTQGMILGSFFYGYIITQIPGGRLAELYSGKWLFGIGVLCTSLFSLLTPLAARAGPGYLVAARVMAGLGEGVTYPSMHSMIARWCPLNERTRFVTVAHSGGYLGTVLAMPLTGYLCMYGFDGGWPSVFYVFGGLGSVWFILWAIFAYDSPDKHPWISTAEKLYIQRETNCYHRALKIPPIRWRELATSLPLWAIIVAHFGHSWGFYTLLTELPTYLKTILGFDLAQNSVLSALPYFTAWMWALLVSYTCDILIEKNYVNVTNVRKIATSLGLLVPAGLLIGLTFVGCDSTLSFAILVISMTLNSSSCGGYLCNHIDIAPNFAGTLFGITNTISTIPGWMGPYTVGALTQGKPYRNQWDKVFYITAGFNVISAIFYIVFGSGTEQAWNKSMMEESVVNGSAKGNVNGVAIGIVNGVTNGVGNGCMKGGANGNANIKSDKREVTKSIYSKPTV